MDRATNAFSIIAGLIFNPEIRNEEGVDPLLDEYFWDVTNLSYQLFKGLIIKKGNPLYCNGKSRELNSEIPTRKIDI